MPDKKPFYIPGIPENLQGILYTPEYGEGEVKQLRQKAAGNPAAQQRLAVDDRYWQGRRMAEESPLAAAATWAGSIPYDAAKLAYFNGPAPVRKGLEQLTEKLFPGEAFNGQTTSRPSRAASGAHLNGIVEGTYGKLRSGLEAMNRTVLPDRVIDAGRAFTEHANFQPTLANRLLGDNQPDIDLPGLKGEAREKGLRQSLMAWGAKNALANGVDFTGTFKKALATMLQTANGDLDTRPRVDSWAEPDTLFLQSAAPGLTPLARMSPEAKAKQNAAIAATMSEWGKHRTTHPLPAAPAIQFPYTQSVPLISLD